MTRAKWDEIRRKKRMEMYGTEEAEPKGALHYATTHVAEAERAARPRGCGATSRRAPRGERDVSAILDAKERERGTWLREVLEACDE